MASKPWRGLQAELDELEGKDPKVREARRRLDELPDDTDRYKRHMAARKKVGKRPLPDDADP